MAEYSNLFVVLMGLGTVFFGLACIIGLTMLMGRILGTHAALTAPGAPVRTAAAPAAGVKAAEEVPPEVAAAITAVFSADPELLPAGSAITGIRKTQ